VITISIPGPPIAKKRPRFARRGKFVTTYDPQETEEGKFIVQVLQQFKGPPLTGYLSLGCSFLMPIPKSTSNKKRKLMLEETIRPDKKPDLSNLVKFVEDCLNGVIWQDDAQIVSYQRMHKFYSEEPMTVIFIDRIGDTECA
jgi:Holliday junction resolvase RusA-like endonuclease